MLRKGDCLPLTIVNMMALTTLLTARAEGTSVIMDQMYAKSVAQWIEREAVSVWNGPPALLHSMITDSDIGRPALRSLNECWSGGSALPETLRGQFTERFGVPVIGTYGLTEAPTIVSIDPPDGEFVPGASGQVLAHLRLTIADSAADMSGEICLSAADSGPFAGLYHPPLGYWQRPEASAQLCAGGMVHTGDIGFVSDGDWLHVLDRRNLLIVRGGANVYPAEVERVINDIPGVAASAVIGFPDERLGERVAAAVVLDDGARLTVEQIAERCLTELAKYKVPERLAVVDSLPRNAMGKVDRTAVRALLSEC
jgi:acyl-CoA synthetase (AMP-forming)/AMP-acid ligase II